MSSFVPNKHHLREVLIFCFNWKKSAAEAHRMLVEVYGESAPSDKSCREWFRRFQSGDFSVEDKERSGQPKKFEDEELETLLDQDSCQTQKELNKQKHWKLFNKLFRNDSKPWDTSKSKEIGSYTN